jgi:hypothetical protein
VSSQRFNVRQPQKQQQWLANAANLASSPGMDEAKKLVGNTGKVLFQVPEREDL